MEPGNDIKQSCHDSCVYMVVQGGYYQHNISVDLYTEA